MKGFLQLYDKHELPLIGWAPGKDVGISLEAALKAGCRYICTDCNNQDEIEVGRILARWLRENDVNRKDVFVSAKLPFIGNQHSRVKHFAQKSLENLGLAYVDLYLISSPVGFKYINDETCFPFKNNEIDLDRQTDIISVWKTIELLVDLGMAKSIGVCYFNQRQLRIIVRHARVPPSVLLVECHAYYQQRELQAFCKKYEIAIYSTFPAGFNGNFCPRTLTTIGSQPDNNLQPKLDPLIRKLSFRHNVKPFQVLVSFLIHNNIGIIISGSESNEVINYTQLLYFQLKNEELEAIFELEKGNRGRTFNFSDLCKGFDTHPENPFNDAFAFNKSFHKEFTVASFPRNWH